MEATKEERNYTEKMQEMQPKFLRGHVMWRRAAAADDNSSGSSSSSGFRMSWDRMSSIDSERKDFPP